RGDPTPRRKDCRCRPSTGTHRKIRPRPGPGGSVSSGIRRGGRKMSLLTAELRKVWGNRVFPILLAVLVAANLLLLWIGTRPTANQPPAAAYRAVGADLAALGSDMAAKGDFLHGKLDEAESLLRLENYFRDSAYGNSVIQQNYREENAELFDQYEQIYRDKSYTLYTDS